MFLKNKNIIFKIRRSKVTAYAALKETPDHREIQVSRCIWFVSESVCADATSHSHVKMDMRVDPICCTFRSYPGSEFVEANT